MAAAGGFWAKGTFLSAVDVAVLGGAFASVGPDVDKMKAAIAGAKEWQSWNDPALLKGAVQSDLLYWHASVSDGYTPYSYNKAIEKIGKEKLDAAIENAVYQKAVADKAWAESVATTTQGVSFTNGEIEALANANGLTFEKMQAKLDAYKTPTQVNKWKAAVVDGTLTLPKTTPKAPKLGPDGQPLPKPAATLGTKDLSAYQALLPSEYDAKPSGYSVTDLTAAYTPWAKSLSPDKKETVAWYTGSGYGGLNKAMRSADWDPEKWSTSSLTAKSKSIQAAIDQAPPLPKNTTFFRGFGNADIHDAVKSGKLTAGSQVIDPAFMSSTTSVSTGKKFMDYNNAVFYRIVAPKGTTGGAYIKPVSYHSSENEFLWGAGKPMTVLGAKMGYVGGVYAAIVDLVPTEAVKD